MAEQEAVSLIALTSQIVSAHVAHNTVPVDELPQLIRNVYAALGNATVPAPPVAKEPAAPIKNSVKPDAITCLECGSAFKMLKRHLNSEHQLSPSDYRKKWGLPANYPVVAPNYAKTRSTLAKKIGLGRVRAALPAPRKKAAAAKRR